MERDDWLSSLLKQSHFVWLGCKHRLMHFCYISNKPVQKLFPPAVFKNSCCYYDNTGTTVEANPLLKSNRFRLHLNLWQMFDSNLVVCHFAFLPKSQTFVVYSFGWVDSGTCHQTTLILNKWNHSPRVPRVLKLIMKLFLLCKWPITHVIGHLHAQMHEKKRQDWK